MAVTRAPKKGGKAGKSKSKPAAKKSSAKKVVAKKYIIVKECSHYFLK